jgi:hypothetical protein
MSAAGSADACSRSTSEAGPERPDPKGQERTR